MKERACIHTVEGERRLDNLYVDAQRDTWLTTSPTSYNVLKFCTSTLVSPQSCGLRLRLSHTWHAQQNGENLRLQIKKSYPEKARQTGFRVDSIAKLDA